jgi:hypothetical protein
MSRITSKTSEGILCINNPNAQLKKELQDAVTASDVGGNVVKATNENKKFKKRTV